MANHKAAVAEMETANGENHQLDLIPQSKEDGADPVEKDAQLLKKGGQEKPTTSRDVVNGKC